MAAKKNKQPAAEPGAPLRGEAAWQAAKQKVAAANALGHAEDRAKRDVSEAKAARQRGENSRLEDADLNRRDT